ncbi:MAG: hypothetical protein ACKOHK_02315, partial [Planctomycetia bacterium]
MPGSPAIPGSRGAGRDDAGERLASVAIRALPQVAMLAGSLALACGAVLVLRRLAGAIEPPSGPGMAGEPGMTCAPAGNRPWQR